MLVHGARRGTSPAGGPTVASRSALLGLAPLPRSRSAGAVASPALVLLVAVAGRLPSSWSRGSTSRSCWSSPRRRSRVRSAMGPAGISVTKLAGVVCIVSFRVRDRQRAAAAASSNEARRSCSGSSRSRCSRRPGRPRTPPRRSRRRRATRASRCVYVILTQFGRRPGAAAADRVDAGDHVLDRGGVSGSTSTFPASAPARDARRHAQQNDFAFILATSLPLMFLLLGSTRQLRPLLLGAIGLVSAAILLSLSRGALVGLAAGFLLFVLTDRRRLQVVARPRRARRDRRDRARDPQQPGSASRAR